MLFFLSMQILIFAPETSNMRSKFFLFSVLLFSLTPFSAKPQAFKVQLKDSEVFLGLGTTNYFGDIGGRDRTISGPQAFFDHLDIDLWQTRMMCSAGARVTPWKSVAISTQAALILLGGNDLRSNYAWRGYNFKTSVVEFSAQAEYYFAHRITGFAPFGFLGIGAMFYKYENSLNVVSKWDSGNTILLGAGIRFPELKKFTHALDAGFHFTTTDYIDGYSTERQSSDLFFIISYKLNLKVFSLFYYDHRGLVK
jgi:hypothetical protein